MLNKFLFGDLDDSSTYLVRNLARLNRYTPSYHFMRVLYINVKIRFSRFLTLSHFSFRSTPKQQNYTKWDNTVNILSLQCYQEKPPQLIHWVVFTSRDFLQANFIGAKVIGNESTIYCNSFQLSHESSS